MKLKLFSLLAGVIALASCSTSRVSTSNNPAYSLPSAIQSRFEVQYPTATNVTWTTYDPATSTIDWELSGWPAVDANDYVVQFDLGSDRFYSWYDVNGEWIGSAYAIDNYSVLPYAVSNTISTQFKDYTITSVNKEMWGENTAYEIKLKKMEDDSKVKLLIDQNGTIIRQKDKE
jgi:hypothetical protein